jgi:hypothetical protein
MNDRPTPETDAATHDLSDYGPPVPCSWGDWVAADFARKLERERDAAKKDLETIQEYGTEEINAAVDLRQQLASALVEKDLAMDVLSKVSHFLSCGVRDERDETTTAKQFGDRIIYGFVDLSHRLGGERDLAEAEKTLLIKELKEAWRAMDEIEGTERINAWQNKNAYLLEKQDENG